MKKAVQQGTVLEEEGAKVFVDGKDAVSVGDIDKFKRHRGSALHGILIATGRAETAMTAKGDKLELSAFGTAVHSTTVGRIATVDRLIHVFNDRIAWVKDI